MKKFLVFILTVVATAVIAGVYGALHNQVTYTISNEYFTKFKYNQFGFEPEWFGGDRPTVALIGFLSSWWAGAVVGMVLSIAGMFHRDWKSMLRWTSKAVFAMLLTALLFGLAGYMYGAFGDHQPVGALMVDDVVDRKNFFVAGSIHNFSYLGAGFGLFAGTVYIFMHRKKSVQRADTNPTRKDRSC